MYTFVLCFISSFGTVFELRLTRLIKQAVGGRPPQYAPPSVILTLDLLTLKMVSDSRVTWATSVPILVFLCLSVLDLGPMYATDRRQTDSQTSHSITA